MKDLQGSSDTVVVSDLKQAQVITDRTQLRKLAPFMGQEISIKQAAAQLTLTVTATYKIARRFLELGLLQETRREQRAGRAIRYYRAPAEFFVPFWVLGLEQMGERNRHSQLERFDRNLSLALRDTVQMGWGSTARKLPSGEVYYQVTNADGQMWDQMTDPAPAMLAGWNLITLRPDEARQLQHQLAELLEPYLQRRVEGEAYLTGIFLVRDYGVQP